MNNTSYEDKIIDAIQAVVDDSISKAGYDRTIQATIVECVDEALGKYKVKFQDSTFYAYSESIDIKYTKGTEAYVLIPRNDMSLDKTILGSTKKLGADYLVPSDDNYIYEVIGSNCIQSFTKNEFTSYKEETIDIFNKENNNNNCRLNEKALEQYLKESNSLRIAAKFKAIIPGEQTYGYGDYGIGIDIVFKDSATNGEIKKNYEFTTASEGFEGNKYDLKLFHKMQTHFGIDGSNFLRVERLYVFNRNFPIQKAGMPIDIWIEDIEILGCRRLLQEDLQDYRLSFITPQGTFFEESDLDSATRDIQAQIRIKGTILSQDSNLVDYY